MDVVFNINSLAMEGLGATLTSLLRNCPSDKELKLWFLCSELSDSDKENIGQLLQNESFEGNVEFVDFNAKKQFGHLRSLHGDWTAYGRLLIPEIIKSDYAVYLDSDLVINADVLELRNHRTEKILSAICGSTVLHVLENPFFIEKLKWKSDTGYFNSGVLIFNILKWKEGSCDEKLEQIAKQYSNEFLSADQTLLNALCQGDFSHLPKKFNLAWSPGNTQPEGVENSIVHFVGSPKPWDLFGQLVHAGYGTWEAYNTQFWKSQYGRITVDKLRRTWKIRRSIAKHLKKRLTS